MGWVEKLQAAVVDGDQSTERSKIGLRTPQFYARSGPWQTLARRRSVIGSSGKTSGQTNR
jgi:hypothetical protein